ncbi:RHS repeat domain-containing protein [Chitinophaga tropicalis]|uniref:YD repeat-containing protein n=1 Tax=Chitinophaga tropicalis TaxID=2683588 RepID=A0A7K1TX12_9BACT|nr:hypothetical protein [Chitinophaga tropicalis]MVT06626.1 hypothetical protein [Chitinophaga tropicalis]
MNRLILCALLCFCFLSLSAQNDLGSIGPTRVIAPNPEAAKLASYGKYDISYYTGKPDINIPLYTIQTSDLSLPVSLVYESTGLRTDDLASWAGTGWILNGVGSITRVVVGMPDDYSGGYLTQSIPYTGAISQDYYYAAAYTHTKDTEPDRYYFNFNGHSGEFTFDTSKNVFQIPLSGVRIRRAGADFEITDEEGIIYEFKTREMTAMMINSDVDYLPQSISTWWLTRITSADKSDGINFYYSQDPYEKEDKPNYSAAYGPKYTLGSTSSGASTISLTGNVLDYSSSVMNREYSPFRVDSITFNNGKLVFNRIKDRLDGGSSRLGSIDVYALANNVYQKRRSFNLLHSNFQYTGTYYNNLVLYSQYTGRYRLKLTGLEERKGDGTLNGTYNFEYDEAQQVGYRGTLQQDYWGFYNGATINDAKQTLIPTQNTPDYAYTVGGADREPNADYMKAGILKKIIYPTGGYTVFNWEPHKYLASGTTTVDHSSTCIAFGNNSSNDPHPTQTINLTIPVNDPSAKITVNISTYPHPSNPQYDNPDYQTMEENTRPNVSLTNASTGQVLYSNVNNNPQGSVNAITNISLPAGNYILTSNCYANSTNAYASIAVQWHTEEDVEVIKVAGGLRIADISSYDPDNKQLTKESYRYGANETGYGKLSIYPAYMNTLTYTKNFKFSYLSTLGVGCNYGVTSRTLYKSEPVATMSLASGSSVTYTVVTKYVGDPQTNAGKSIYYYRDIAELDIQRFPTGQTGEYMVTKYGWRRPVISKEENYKKVASGYQLVKSTENEYTELGTNIFPVIKLGFKYENVSLGCFGPGIDDYYAATYYIQTAKTQLTSSKVKDYDAGGTLFLETQKTFTYDSKYRSFPVDQTLVNSKGETKKTTTRYPFDKSTIVGLSTAKTIVLDTMVARNILAPPIQQDNYVNTNLVLRKTDTYKIWDAAKNVVKADTTYLQLLTNSREPRVVYDNYDAKGNILQQSKNYDAKEVYVWGYNYQYPVAKVLGSDYNTVISLLDTSIIQHPASDAQLRTELNKLRVAASMKNTQVSTYTYLPAVGMTSVTDPAGRTLYYEYDSMQRLRITRDQNGNIIQQTDYQYKTALTN